ncbi:GlxA family transcriptional regulator [Consotaella aegiceratis]|uniref:GlxA family transcriptional regulator n=1 Tax=Consotaella aegiceratis TaxID=3097961 RepID=UPI002F3F2DDA
MPIVPHRVEILAFAKAQLLDVTGPAQVFASTNDLAPRGEARPYAIEIVAETEEVVTSSGIGLRAKVLPRGARAPDTLIVAGGYGVGAACERAELVDWVRRRCADAARVASVCSGAFLLAETGLLDGRRAVTHWQRCEEFAARFPAVRLEPDPIFVRDGAIWTSAGITAGIDLALAMVEEDRGRELALAVARQLVVFLKRPGGQAQFSTALSLQAADSRFEHLHGWIADHLDGDVSLAAMADQAGMSLRSFCRHYRQTTGRTPAQSVELIRIETARQLLEDGASVTRTLRRCGFGSPETMRRAFLKHLGIGPQAYRERFSRQEARTR